MDPGSPDTAARLLRLLALLQTPKEWPGSELATRLQVSARTVRRDVERLRNLGYPVEASIGATGGYRLVAGAAIPPLLLDDDEAVAIAVGLRVGAGHVVEGVEEASLRALTKVIQVLPTRLRARVSALDAATSTIAVGGASSVEVEALVVLANAIAGQQRLLFGYRASDGTESERRAEPHGVVSAGRRWYVVAFDVERDDWRIFRADRIRDPRPSGGRAQHHELPAVTPAEYVLARMSELGPTYEAVITLKLSAEDAMSRLGANSGRIEAIDSGSCRWFCLPDTLQWLALRLVLLECEFHVDEPSELADHLQALGDRLMRSIGPWPRRTSQPEMTFGP